MSNVDACMDFNSHAHVERDFVTIRNIYQPVNFNSHAHVERDQTHFTTLAL